MLIDSAVFWMPSPSSPKPVWIIFLNAGKIPFRKLKEKSLAAQFFPLQNE